MSLTAAIQALIQSVNILQKSTSSLLRFLLSSKGIGTVGTGASLTSVKQGLKSSADIKTLSTMTKGIFDVVNKNTAGIGSLTEDMRLVALDTEIIRRLLPGTPSKPKTKGNPDPFNDIPDPSRPQRKPPLMPRHPALLDQIPATKSLSNITAEVNKMTGGVETLNQVMKKTSSQGLNELFRSMEDLVINGKSLRNVFKDIGESLLRNLVKNIEKNVPKKSGDFVFNPTSGKGILSELTGSIFDMLGFRADGGAVGPGRGFIVGERGPELLMMGSSAGSVTPLSRIGNGGGGNVNVNIINNSENQVTTRESQSSGGTRNIEVVIDGMVAKSLARSGSQTHKVLNTLFGINPTLIRR